MCRLGLAVTGAARATVIGMAADSTEVADALLLRLRTLQVQCATLTRVALYSAKPPVAFEVSSPLTNRPTSAAFRSSLKPLSSRHRRYTGTPFFVGFDGDVPDPNPDQVRRESAPETKLKLREQHLRFTADDDNALLAAVLHVHRAERFAEALARYGLTFPSAFLPLGSVSTPALEPSQLGPRADTQYSDCFSAASLPAQAWAALDTLSRATLERELDEIASAPPAVLLARVQDCDWVRVCHGGFLRSKLGARPSDARVRWCAHVRPGLYNGAWVASERSQLAQIAARHDFRDWATIAAELAGEGKKLRSAWDCFHEYRHSTQAGVRDSAARGGAAALDEIADVGLDVEDGDAEGIATPEVSNSSLGLENTGVGVGTPLTRGGGRVRAAPGSRKWTAEHDARAVIFVSARESPCSLPPGASQARTCASLAVTGTCDGRGSDGAVQFARALEARGHLPFSAWTGG